jgi:hypothetical protein
MQYILVLAMIALLGGADSAVADNHGRNDERNAQGRSISTDNVSRLGKALTIAQGKLEAYGWQICPSPSDALRHPKVTYARSGQGECSISADD